VGELVGAAGCWIKKSLTTKDTKSTKEVHRFHRLTQIF